MSEHTSEKAQTNAEKNSAESVEDVSTLDEKNEVSNDHEIEIEDIPDKKVERAVAKVIQSE